MLLKRLIYFFLIGSITTIVGCKANRCPNFEGDGAKHHVNYDKNGLVKKKGAAPSRTWDNY